MSFTIGCGGGAYGVSLANISRCFSVEAVVVLSVNSVWLRYNNHFNATCEYTHQKSLVAVHN